MRLQWVLGTTALFLAASVANADTLSPGGSASFSSSPYSALATQVADSGAVSFSFFGNTGTVEEWVFSGYGANPFVNGTLGSDSNALSLFYYIQVTAGSVDGLQASSFDSSTLDVGYGYNLFGSIAPNNSSTIAPTGAFRSSDGTMVEFGFNTAVSAGDNSAILIVNSSLDTYIQGTWMATSGELAQCFIDQGFVPGAPSPAPTSTPEPASLTLLGLSACGLIGYAWRRRRLALA